MTLKNKARSDEVASPRKPVRSAEQLVRAERQERWEARRLPLMFGGILLLVLVSRVEGLREGAGRAGAYAFPLMAAFFATRPFRDSALASAAIVVAIGASVASLAVLTVAAPSTSPAHRGLLLALVLAPVVGAVLQGFGAARGIRSYCAAWLGMGAMFAHFYAGHRVGGHDAFDAILGAGLVALFVGGGAGILLGIVATAFGKRG